jgi:ATP-dependent exoDNAse (exonuclease V) alpha subunit
MPRYAAEGDSKPYMVNQCDSAPRREHGVVGEISADALTVRRSDGSNLRLARDRVLSLDYGYAVTGHSAQGPDASLVILEKDTHSRTTDRRSFYTDITRARNAAVVITDSVARLARRANIDRRKFAALEVAASADLSLAGDAS